MHVCLNIVGNAWPEEIVLEAPLCLGDTEVVLGITVCREEGLAHCPV